MNRPMSAWVLMLGMGCGLQTHVFGAESKGLPLVQMNLSGAAFNAEVIPGKLNFNFFFPGPESLEQWRLRGIKVIRFPLVWERLQPTLNGRFDPTYAGFIDTLLKQAADKGLALILDVHNYGRFRGQVLGSPQVPLSAYRDLMARIAARWHVSPGLHGYDLMNEPHDQADAGWPQAAQAGIDGIRSVDVQKPIFVEGRQWSSTVNWPNLNDPLLALRDPADKLVFSAHLYLDDNASGTYQRGPGAAFDTQVGVQRAKPFVEWLKHHGKQGHIGEFGFPADDPRWAEAAVPLLNYLKAQCVPVAYWAAGPGWGPGGTSVEPENGVDRAQWKTVAPYVNAGNCKLAY